MGDRGGMLLVDPRAGSNELLAPLQKAGLPAEFCELPFGDLAFRGRGEGGTPLVIAVEHKKLPDLVQSLATERLAGHQLPGLLEFADRPYLIIEGDWDHDAKGKVVVFGAFKGRRVPLKGAPPASVLEQRIITLETRGGLRIRWTRSQKETVRYVCALFRFWTDRDLDGHRSHLAIHSPDLDRALQIPLSVARRAAAVLPGIGYEKSKAVADYFSNSITTMGNATEAEWMEIDGIGKTLAKRLVAACRNKENE